MAELEDVVPSSKGPKRTIKTKSVPQIHKLSAGKVMTNQDLARTRMGQENSVLDLSYQDDIEPLEDIEAIDSDVESYLAKLE